MKTSNEAALKGIQVLDFTRVYSGPYCTMMLADMGAEVIKIERPDGGDDSRGYMPFQNGESGYFITLNRNKKGITLDLKSAEGKNIALQLAAKSDIVVENFSPGTMARLGLAYEDIKKVNPKVIYASISGFGQYGPLCHKVAYDSVVQAMAGLMAINGYPDCPPLKVGTSIADANAGIHCAFAIMTALFYRERSGKGQYIDISMVESLLSVMENNVVKFTMAGTESQRIGNFSDSLAPFGVYRTKDDYIVIGCGNNGIFDRLLQAMHQEKLLQDDRFITNSLRVVHQKELTQIIERWSMMYTTNAIVSLLDSYRVPVAPILTMEQVLHQPQIAVRGMLVETNHPVAGKVVMTGSAMNLSVTPGNVYKTAPLLGQDTDEILRDKLAMTEEEIDRLKQKDIL